MTDNLLAAINVSPPVEADDRARWTVGETRDDVPPGPPPEDAVRDDSQDEEEAALGREGAAAVLAHGDALLARLARSNHRRSPFRLVTDQEWMGEPPPEPLIDGLGLAAGSLGAIVSAPGTGKTFVALSIASALALGADWLGHHIASRGPIVYAVGEGHAAFPLRLQALRAYHGLRDADPSGVLYLREPVSLLLSDAVAGLLASVRDALAGIPPRAFVFDPLASFMAGGDENSTQDMSLVVASLNRIRAETGAAVLVAHHTGWNAERERGSTVLRAAMDAMFNLKADDGVLTLECTKLRDGVMPEPLRLQLRPVAGSCVVERSTASSETQAATLTPKQREVLDALRRIVIDEPVSFSRWREASGVAETTFETAQAALVKGGWVHKTGKGRSARYAPPGRSRPPISPRRRRLPPSCSDGGNSDSPPFTPRYPHTPRCAEKRSGTRHSRRSPRSPPSHPTRAPTSPPFTPGALYKARGRGSGSGVRTRRQRHGPPFRRALEKQTDRPPSSLPSACVRGVAGPSCGVWSRSMGRGVLTRCRCGRSARRSATSSASSGVRQAAGAAVAWLGGGR